MQTAQGLTSGQNATSSSEALDQSAPYHHPAESETKFQRLTLLLRKWPLLWSLGLSVVLALVLEGLVFNYAYFSFDQSKYPQREISLPFNEQLQQKAFVFSQQQTHINLSGINFPVNRIYLEFSGIREQVKGRILIKDHSSSMQSYSANTFVVDPNLAEFNHVNKLLLVSSPLVECSVVLESFKAPQVLLTRLVFNTPVEYYFNGLRFGFMVLLGFVVLLTLLTRFYTEELNWQKRSHKIIQGSLLVFCCALAIGQLVMLHPANSKPLAFKFLEYGALILSNHNSSLWTDLPQTSEELEMHDQFTQQLDAYLNGRLHLNLRAHPQLEQLEHPYDKTVRQAESVYSQWDHSYYNNKFYSYYAPSLVLWFYAPLYLLTGQLPMPILAITILTLLTIVTAFWLLPVLHKAWNLRSNALLFFVSELVLVGGSMLFYLQATVFFYSLPILNNFIFGMLLIGCAYQALLTQRTWLRQLLLAIVGLMVVGIVLSRATGLFICLALITPAMYQFFLAPEVRQNRQLLKQHCRDSLWGLGIVILGAIGVMWFNHARFDSVFEFGQRFCTSWIDVTSQYANAAEFRLINFSNSFYHGFVESYVINKDFPFVTSNTDKENNYAANLVKMANVGIWSIPNQILLGLWLVLWFVKFPKPKLHNQSEPSLGQHESHEHEPQLLEAPQPSATQLISTRLWQAMRYSFVLCIASLIITSYFNFSFGSPCTRYSIELLFFSNILVCLLSLKLVKFCPAKQTYQSSQSTISPELLSQIFYWLVIGLSLYAALIGTMITFEQYVGGNIAGDLNPDVLLYFKRIFEPFAGV